MSKAKERAAKLIIPKQVDDVEELCRFYFINGYKQAQRDLELTWEDLATIEKLRDDFIKQNQTVMSNEEFYKEVLKRFKEGKEK